MTDTLSKLSITLTLLGMFSFPGFAATDVDFKKLRPHSVGFFRLSHEYRTLKSISLMNCLIQGQMDRHCKAISYNEIFRYCELNYKSGLYDEVDSTVAEGWITYNVINETVREGTVSTTQSTTTTPKQTTTKSTTKTTTSPTTKTTTSLTTRTTTSPTTKTTTSTTTKTTLPTTKTTTSPTTRTTTQQQTTTTTKSTSPDTVSTGPCKTDWHYYEGSCYLFKLDGDKKNWIGAADACADEGAGLVRIESQAEDDFILAKVEELIDDVTGVFIFTAGNDRETEGSWVWSGASNEEVGEPLQYMNWFMGEPNGMVIENCLAAYPMHKTWVDIQCDNINYYICEDQNPVL